MDEVVFTPAAILDFLTQIDELSDKSIELTEQDSTINVKIGNSVYQLNTESAEDIVVDESVVEQVAEVNDEAYDELEASGSVDLSEPVESGIIKSIAKSLLLGGMIRLAPKLLK